MSGREKRVKERRGEEEKEEDEEIYNIVLSRPVQIKKKRKKNPVNRLRL